jgi:hypothetical protein
MHGKRVYHDAWNVSKFKKGFCTQPFFWHNKHLPTKKISILINQDRGTVASAAIGPGWAGVANLPPSSPYHGLGPGGGDGDNDGNKDAKNKRWAESMGMDITQGRGRRR